MAVAAVAIASTAVGAFVSGAVVATVGTIAAAAIGAVASIAVSYVGTKLFGLDQAPSRAVSDPGRLIPSLSGTTAQQHHYGRVRVGGAITWRSNRQGQGSGKNNEFWQVQTLSGSPIDDVEEVWIDNKKVFLDSGGFATSAPYAVPGNALFGAWYADGRQQVAEPLLRNRFPADWTVDHIGHDHAYIAWAAYYDAKAFPNGLPHVTVILRGRRVYDPRDGMQDPFDDTTWAWSDNAALCVIDYVMADFGLGWDPNLIDWDTVIAAANICDEEVLTANGGTEKRYRCWGTFDTTEDRSTVLNNLLASMAGTRVEQAGVFAIYAGAYQPPVMTIDADGMGELFRFRPYKSVRDRVNQVRGNFVSIQHNYTAVTYPDQIDPVARARDGDLVEVLDLPFAASVHQAQRIARIRLNRMQAEAEAEVLMDLRAVAVGAGENVALTYTLFEGHELINAPFKVQKWQMTADGDVLFVNMTLSADAPEIYTPPPLTFVDSNPVFPVQDNDLPPGEVTDVTVEPIY